MSLSPLDVYIHHKKPIVQIKKNVHYKCNITVLNLTVLYYFCVIECSPNYSDFTREIVIMFFSPVGHKNVVNLKTHKIIKDIL